MKEIKSFGIFIKHPHGGNKMKTKKTVVLIILIVAAIMLCIFFINTINKSKNNNITPSKAIIVISEKYNLDKSLLEYAGIDERTNLYIINLSPGESKGAAGRTFYVDPITSNVKE